MPFKVRVKIEGLAPLLAKLDGLKRAVQKTAIRRAVDQAGKVVLDAAKAAVPTNTGLLKKSLGRKVVIGRRSGVAIAIVGPRTGFKVIHTEARFNKKGEALKTQTGFTMSGRKTKGKKVILKLGSRSPLMSNPTRYAHLVEYGRSRVLPQTALVLSMPGIGFRPEAAPVQGTKFLENSLNRSKAAIVAAMSKAIDEALIKAAKKGK